MKLATRLSPLIALLLIGELAAAPLAARRGTRPQPLSAIAIQQDDDANGVTFDNLLRASSYSLYIEARNIGAVLRSTEFRETFEPILPLLDRFVGGGAEVTLGRLVTDNADRLQHSRVMLAFSPVDSSLPGQLIAIELESEDAAKEFEAMAKERFTSLASAAQKGSKAAGAETKDGTNSINTGIRRVDRLVVISMAPFTFKALRGANDKPMSDDINFRTVRDRFSAEPLFFYYDTSLSNRQRKAVEDALPKSSEPDTNAPPSSTAEVAAPVDIETESSGVLEGKTPPRPATATSNRAVATQRRAPSPAPAPRGSRVTPPPPLTIARPVPTIQLNAQPPTGKEPDPLGDLLSLIVSGESQTPEGVGFALALENDALVIRALLIGPPGAGVGPVPFLSSPICGPPISPEAANYLPADTGIYVAASLDWARLYEMTTHPPHTSRGMSKEKAAQVASLEARRAAFEKANGVHLIDLLSASLGNEIALSVPASYLGSTPLGRVPTNARAAVPLMLVAVRDREALAPRLPALLETIGVKLASAKATTEKAGDIEISSHGNLAYAFVNNYLMMAANAATIRQALEARAQHATLAESRDFQSYTGWQPQTTVTLIYVSAGLLKGWMPDKSPIKDIADEATKEFLARFHFEPEPVTFVASAEGVGAHYELRLPRHLLMRVFAETAAAEMATRIPRNETTARSFLRSIKEYEETYKKQHGRYGTLDELNDISFMKDTLDRMGYKLEVTASGGSYEATATPTEYGKTGRLSFYIDQSGVVREGDHQGRPASSSDKPTSNKEEY
ncbi:MAG: DUF3352 domain-containing protein [Blastocatellia bacterium]